MLSTLESDLIRRDPDLPGLRTVLDPEEFLAALQRAAPQADIRSARNIYAGYKPGTHCLATYQVDIAGQEVSVGAHACPPGHRALVPKGHGNIPCPLVPARLVLEDCAVVVSAFPNDLKLRKLHHLADALKRRRLLQQLLPDRPEFWEADLTCLRYVPERRFVAELRAADGSRVLLKSYTRKAYDRAHRNAFAFHSRAPLRIARPVGCLEDYRMIAFEWLPGQVLAELCAYHPLGREAVQATGSALAELHTQKPDGLICWSRENETDYLEALAEDIGFISPALAQRAGKLARRISVRLADAPPLQVAMHGDFSLKQVLLDRDSAAIIDLDWACCGDPADDLGNMSAQIENYALLGKLSSEQAAWLADALLEGYARATNGVLPERIQLYTALGLFRKARFPFRSRETDWPQRTEEILARAEAVSESLCERPALAQRVSATTEGSSGGNQIQLQPEGNP